ncbi:hypothetical protein ABI_12920 [Asticcacaulis biprosthecium C19]|uniref:Uncharacterized protein n=1 Tax=Asticcacaulis biprosthecium C19 TaxID=715226 RepID=F4QHW7_9CAUL|nr:hypothetical protein [Asticcacaulis biprosthecium]EGF92854.1 hypothetical protein ABI_12920 [Asticcacaulis biprosthecium C19]
MAATLSVALHLLALSALTLSSASDPSPVKLEGEGISDLEGLEVDLVGLVDSFEPPAVPAPTTAEMFSDMTESDPAPSSAEDSFTPSKKPLSLAEALGGNPFQPDSAPQSRTADESHVRADNRTNKTPNELWKAIEPCWNRVTDKSTLDVTLEVSFSPLGNLARPPVIKRTHGALLNDRVLRSENQAITALAQCGPYLMAYGQDQVEIQFPSRKG